MLCIGISFFLQTSSLLLAFMRQLRYRASTLVSQELNALFDTAQEIMARARGETNAFFQKRVKAKQIILNLTQKDLVARADRLKMFARFTIKPLSIARAFALPSAYVSGKIVRNPSLYTLRAGISFFLQKSSLPLPFLHQLRYRASTLVSQELNTLFDTAQEIMARARGQTNAFFQKRVKTKQIILNLTQKDLVARADRLKMFACFTIKPLPVAPLPS